MTITELMNGKETNPSYKGILTTDDYVLAINTDPTNVSPKKDNEYHVLEKGVKGYPSNLNPKEKTRQFIRGGEQTVVLSKQATYNVTGVRFVGDEAQDFLLGYKVMFGVGQDVITDYIYFDIKTGNGWKGKCSISVNSIAEGEAGDDAGFSCSLKGTEIAPKEWSYQKML